MTTAIRWHRPLVYFAGAMAVLSVVAIGGLMVDDRVLVGAPIWLKPFKFAVSFTVYALTLAWMLTLLRRGRRLGWWAGTVIAVAGTIEMVVIVGQVVRGRRSHFNLATPLDSALWSTMGATIMFLWLATAVIAVLLMRRTLADRSTTWAIRLAPVLALIGMAEGYLMTLPTRAQLAMDDPSVVGSHSVGVPEGGPGMPITGWSTTGGDLRVAHFVGMHALQALPLLALLLTVLARRFAPLREDTVRLRLIVVAAVAYAATILLLTWQALRGQPLLSPDSLTLTAAGLIAAGVLIGGGLAFRQPTREPVGA
jgi:hypothetical protein